MFKNEIAELLGIILGDGNISKKGYKLTISGNTEDLLYHETRVIPLIKKYFDVKPKVYKLKNKNSINTEFYSKSLINLLLRLGLQKGRKENLKIPSIVHNNLDTYRYFLRGLFDTDGTIKFSKQNKGINYYPRIEISQKPSKMTYDLKNLIKACQFNFSFCVSDNSRGYLKKDSHLAVYQVSGKENLYRWFKIVKPQNPIHITKYMVWKKFGFCRPYTTLKERIDILK